jgi:hypothetical protein
VVTDRGEEELIVEQKRQEMVPAPQMRITIA